MQPVNSYTNTERVIYAPNRLRHTRKFKFNDDSLHIEGLDLFNVDNEAKYQKNLKKRKNKIPEIAFRENIPNFVTDITSCSDELLKDYSFI